MRDFILGIVAGMAFMLIGFGICKSIDKTYIDESSYRIGFSDGVGAAACTERTGYVKPCFDKYFRKP